MTLHPITQNEILSWAPCISYPINRIQELMGESISPKVVRNLDIPIQDRLWVLIHAMSIENQLFFAAALIERIVPIEKFPHTIRNIMFMRQCAFGRMRLQDLENELRHSQKFFNDVRNFWHVIQNIWISSCVKDIEDKGIIRGIIWLIRKSEILENQNIINGLLDDAVRLLDAE